MNDEEWLVSEVERKRRERRRTKVAKRWVLDLEKGHGRVVETFKKAVKRFLKGSMKRFKKTN